MVLRQLMAFCTRDSQIRMAECNCMRESVSFYFKRLHRYFGI